MKKLLLCAILATALSAFAGRCGTGSSTKKAGTTDTSLRDIRIRTFIPVKDDGVTIVMCVSKKTGAFKYAYLGNDGNWYATNEIWHPGTKIKMGVITLEGNNEVIKK